MAEYQSGSIVVYQQPSGGGSYSPTSISVFNQTLTDLEPDGSFEVGDVIYINGGASGLGFFSGTIQINGETFLAIDNGTQIYLVSYQPPDFDFNNYPETIDPATDFDTSVFAVCFAAGTMIATPDGECAVEALAIGDPVLTADGETVSVKWVGRQTVHKIFTPAERFAPVRIKAGALGAAVPHSDLVLTADHALSIDGILVNAGALVNDQNIDWEPFDVLPERVTYYHVETERHDIILANGAAAETFVDSVTRRRFDNFTEYAALYGDEQAVALREVPRISARRLVPAALHGKIASFIGM